MKDVYSLVIDNNTRLVVCEDSERKFHVSVNGVDFVPLPDIRVLWGHLEQIAPRLCAELKSVNFVPRKFR